MTDEPTIRNKLVEACAQRGVQAELSKAFDVHPSTVKRWVEGGEIPSPMLLLLDWYFFGNLPPSIVANDNLPGTLDLSDVEWKIACLLAQRAGQPVGKWIGATIRIHLDIHRSESAPKTQALPPHKAVPLEAQNFPKEYFPSTPVENAKEKKGS